MLFILIFIALRFDVSNYSKQPDIQPIALHQQNAEVKTENAQSDVNEFSIPLAANALDEQKPATKCCAEHPYDPREDTPYRIYLWATIAGVGGALFGLIFLVKSANAAKENAKAIMDSERAWIVATPTEWNPPLRSYAPHQLRGQNVFRVKFVNVGKTPARIINASLKYILVNSLEDLPAVPVDSPSDPQPRIIVAPNMGADPKEFIGAAAILEQPEGMLSADEHTAVYKGEKILYAFGFVRYLDVYEKERETRFGYKFSVGDALSHGGFQQDGPASYRRTT
jgi:hypothetical protein